MTDDVRGFFEALALEGLYDTPMRLTANLQRRFFGAPIFGKLEIEVSNEGRIFMYRKVAFGQDWNTRTVWFNFFEKSWFTTGNQKLLDREIVHF